MTLAQLTFSPLTNSMTLAAAHQLVIFPKGKVVPKDLPHGNLL